VTACSAGSKALGIEAGVERVDARNNQVTVKTHDDRTASYAPRLLQGVRLYRETERAFAAGDRVQMTALNRERGVPNRELGTVERIDANRRMEIRWDSGRTSSFEASERRHLSQGQTAGRVLVHVETERASEKPVNQRLAYVAVMTRCSASRVPFGGYAALNSDSAPRRVGFTDGYQERRSERPP
jgi:ATP-dependent exoDNAse (exonuclease V) alpha subunit